MEFMQNYTFKQMAAYPTAVFFLGATVYLAGHGDLPAAKDFNRCAGVLSSVNGTSSITAYHITVNGHGTPYAKVINADAFSQGQIDLAFLSPDRA
jgi:hypothetical protein